MFLLQESMVLGTSLFAIVGIAALIILVVVIIIISGKKNMPENELRPVTADRPATDKKSFPWPRILLLAILLFLLVILLRWCDNLHFD